MCDFRGRGHALKGGVLYQVSMPSTNPNGRRSMILSILHTAAVLAPPAALAALAQLATQLRRPCTSSEVPATVADEAAPVPPRTATPATTAPKPCPPKGTPHQRAT
jgi:hypothetical protein